MTLLDRSTSRLPKPVRTALDWAVTIAIAAGAVLVFQAEVAKPFRIPTASMEPTLHCATPSPGCNARLSDRVIANRLAYRFRSPRRGEIVVFRVPQRASTTCPVAGGGDAFVKRIVGLPGETITMTNGFVSANGRRVDETYLRTRTQRGSQTGVWHVPAAHYFVVGDNRTMSCDSRTWGSVTRGNLIGPVLVTYWPPTRLAVH